MTDTIQNTDSAATAASDPFDPANLQLSQDFRESSGVKKPLTTVPVKRVSGFKHDFVRVHPDAQYRLQCMMVEYGEEKELYPLTPYAAQLVPLEGKPFRIYTCIGWRSGVVFLWPVRIPGEGERENPWWLSGHEHADVATKVWTRIFANKGLGAYERKEQTGIKTEPAWPSPMPPLKQLLRIAFKDKLIEGSDHEILKALRGEA